MKHLYDMDLQGERNKADSKNRDTDKTHNLINYYLDAAKDAEREAGRIRDALVAGVIINPKTGDKYDLKNDDATKKQYATEMQRLLGHAEQFRGVANSLLGTKVPSLQAKDAPVTPSPAKEGTCLPGYKWDATKGACVRG
jgi:hypothetical protein